MSSKDSAPFPRPRYPGTEELRKYLVFAVIRRSEIQYDGSIAATDSDPQETREWREAIDVVIERQGPERARYLLEQTFDQAYESGAEPPCAAKTPYVNTIPVSREPQDPPGTTLERHRNGGQGQSKTRRARRTYRELPVLREALRDRL